MDNPIVFEKLFNRDHQDGGNVGMLERVVLDNPTFSVARFFLLQKTNPTSPYYKKDLAKTALFFNNPHWLHFQLQQKGSRIEPIIPMNNTEELILPENTDIKEEEIQVTPEAITNEVAETVPVESINNEVTVSEPSKEEIPQPETSRGLTTDAMLFEPMHMVDYFASQGIKLSEEALTADKLGKQLKSFTEWLKTMKKIHTGSAGLDGAPVEEADRKVQTLADKSNADNEILTESMAEVLMKQGKSARAIEVYEKLSLLNPSKSAYFAAKIDLLKAN